METPGFCFRQHILQQGPSNPIAMVSSVNIERGQYCVLPRGTQPDDASKRAGNLHDPLQSRPTFTRYSKRHNRSVDTFWIGFYSIRTKGGKDKLPHALCIRGPGATNAQS